MSDKYTEFWPTPRRCDAERGGRGDLLGKVRGYQMQHNGTVVPPASRQLTLWPEAFPASPTPWLAYVAALTMNATSGRSLPESFAKLDQGGCWRKTCQGYSQLMLDGSLEAYSETWPRAGMTRSGTAFLLQPLAPLTDVTASGSWPTPDANMGTGGRMFAPDTVSPSGKDLRTGRKRSVPLNAAVRWPTPAARDYRSPSTKVGTPEYFRAPTAGIPLPEAIGGQLNPLWVEWLMGYPLGWTACAASATASCRKLRNGSAAGLARRTRR
jgi:hypothetical protein